MTLWWSLLILQTRFFLIIPVISKKLKEKRKKERKSHNFGLVRFYAISTIVGYLMPNPLCTYILNIYMIWFGWVLCHINHWRLLNTKSSLYIYIKYMILVGWLVGYLGFMAYQPLLVIYCQIHSYTNNRFYF